MEGRMDGSKERSIWKETERWKERKKYLHIRMDKRISKEGHGWNERMEGWIK